VKNYLEKPWQNEFPYENTCQECKDKHAIFLQEGTSLAFSFVGNSLFLFK
jgi:hypothetical protein